jgi:tetratricopeptide (TPR) repeat protein
MIRPLNPADQRQRAIIAAEHALSSEPRDVEACLALGRMLEEHGAPAEGAYARAVLLDPRSVVAHCGRGRSLLRAGRSEQAIASFSAAKILDPASQVARMGLAACHEERGDLAKAVVELEELLQHVPHHLGARRELARLQVKMGDRHGAVASWRMVVAAVPRDPEALVSLGNALSVANQPEEAIEVLRRAAAASPSAETLTHLGRALIAGGRPQEAVVELEDAVRQAPGWQPAIEELARARARLEDATRATPDIRAELRDFTGSADLPLTLLPEEEHESAQGLSGDLAIFPLPDLLEFLRIQSATGRVILRGERGEGWLMLERGRLIDADAPGCAPLRALPVDSPAVLRAAFAHRVTSAMRVLLSWKQGHLSFLPVRPGESCDPRIEVSVDLQMLTLDLLRQEDEARASTA